MAIGQELNATLRGFIERQPVFFVATAALQGRVNISPKGLDTLRIRNDRRILWINLSGSGNETAGHLVENNRMTLMFCAFSGDAMILRVYGHARTVHPSDTDWAELACHFLDMPGTRQIFDLAIDRVQTSCGTGVPLMDFVEQRGTTELLPFYAEMDEARMRDYWLRKNSLSIDGKPTGMARALGVEMREPV